MRTCNYTLSPTRINNAKPQKKLYKLSDGGGLFVEVNPGGVKTWRYQYRFGGTRHEVTIGKYPEIGVADARGIATSSAAPCLSEASIRRKIGDANWRSAGSGPSTAKGQVTTSRRSRSAGFKSV